ncbi:MAG: DUF4932 domain-containing protein [Sedimentisphaerales bacterium]|nr:DUF4932 domain-containing protein [Sedimentisphaerales bacterium]
MRKFALIIMALILFQAGCSMVKPEPVSFTHQDEFIKGKGFMVLADRREFAVMAFLNTVGYDDEVKGQQMHPVRLKVRELVADNLAEQPEKVKTWRKYYSNLMRKHMQAYSFQDFALSLSTDYPFKRIRPDKELGYHNTASVLKDFPEVLNDFWETARLDEVWEQVKPDYIAEIQKYDFDKMQKQMSFLWDYLRMPRHDTLILVNVPNLLESHYNGIGARYENYYYTVESPGSHAYSLNIHEYLHSIVNPIVETNYSHYKKKLIKYYKAGKNEPLSKSYQNPTGFTWECMVRALDRRISIRFEDDLNWTEIRESQVISDTKEGLNLTQLFYKLLAEYEKSGEPFDQFLPKMLERLPEYN